MQSYNFLIYNLVNEILYESIDKCIQLNENSSKCIMEKQICEGLNCGMKKILKVYKDCAISSLLENWMLFGFVVSSLFIFSFEYSFHDNKCRI